MWPGWLRTPLRTPSHLHKHHFPPPPRAPHCAYASLVPDFSCPITANEHQFAQPRAHRFRARVRVPCTRAGSWPSSPLCCLLRLVPRFAPPEASTRVLEPLCAHARDTRGLGSPPRTLPNPLPADRTVFDLPHLVRANKSRYTVELTDTALGPKLVTSSKQSVERRGSQRGATGRKSYRLRTPQCVPQRETSAFGCLAYSGRSWLGSCRVFPFVSRSYWPRSLSRMG